MTDINMQNQINEINQKLDLVLNEVNKQRLKREQLEDLADDLSIIGKDAFTSTVQSLDKAGVDLDYDALNNLIIRFVRNIGTFNQMFETLESVTDLFKDLSPIINQVGVDAINKMTEFEQKGYFEFIAEWMNVFDNMIKNINKEDIKALADNIGLIINIFKNISNAKMLNSVNNTLTVFNNLDNENIEQYSIWKVMRKMNSKEMKHNMGFMMKFLEQLSIQTKSN
ncbi:MAG: hypothetical protein JXR51_14895 [Bacteroidales bacterium]|nr:hypothetical protein [Bacteroidales bacterium]MBN2758458.1 hypothetical protein [Bacteroidales bacterium]